jgi:hypothetical protein
VSIEAHSHSVLFARTEKKITLDVIQEELTTDVYPHFYKMVQLALTLPVGSATAERSFSAMRRIRNWLRSNKQNLDYFKICRYIDRAQNTSENEKLLILMRGCTNIGHI